MLAFNSKTLHERISQLPNFKAAVYGIWQLERLIPNFIRFSSEEEWRGVGVLEQIVGYGWDVAQGLPKSFIMKHLNSRIDSISPDTEEFRSLYASAALDAAVAAGYFIKYLDKKDCTSLVQMSILAVDTVDLFIQLSYDHCDDNSLFENINNHFLMQLELSRQEQDILFLVGGDDDRTLSMKMAMSKTLENDYRQEWLKM